MTSAFELPMRDEIAIVGIGCRYPGGVHGPEAFWEFLTNAGDGVCDVPEDRWSIRDHYDKRTGVQGKTYVKSGAFLTDWSPFDFDPGFFGISVREAETMDPQQRLMLELAWEAAQDAGIPMDALSDAVTGVFLGCFTLDNKTMVFAPSNRGGIDPHTATSSTMAILSNRISYVFDLSGPSFTMDTACSSSMVALHNAVLAMRNGDCNRALVGGVNIMLKPEYFMAMGSGGYLAADGRCKSFDSRADGYGRGEGGGMILLKPLSEAQRDGDRIYAVLAGTGINQDGHTNGMSVPSEDAQRGLIETVLRKSGVAAKDITYVEAHGTGTPVGDPIECRALGATYGKDRDAPCTIGSLKSAIGHQEAGAGVAGVIKAALTLRHGHCAPQSGLADLNPNIPFAELGLHVSRDTSPLPQSHQNHAAVNSFGYGGTNGHAVLRAAPSPAQSGSMRPEQAPAFAQTGLIVPLSAKDPNALREVARDFAKALKSASDPAAVADLIWSTAHRQTQLEHRLVAQGTSVDAVISSLETYAAEGFDENCVTGRVVATLSSSTTPKPVFVFSGMGPQWWAMGQELYRAEPVFRAMVQRCDAAFEAVSGWSIWAEMAKPEADSNMSDTRIAQPANVVLQLALTALYESCGVTPATVVGHSVGEIASAAVSGALRIEDAMSVAYHRSTVQARAAGQGAMLAVALEEAECAAMIAQLAPDVAIAAINAPGTMTLAGREDHLRTVADHLSEQGTFNRFLAVEIAYHSAQMDPHREALLDSLSGIVGKTPTVPLVSSVTGQPVDTATFDAPYWWQNVRQPVRFRDAIETLLAQGHRHFLEVGPHPVISSAIRSVAKNMREPVAVLSTLSRKSPEVPQFARAVAELHCAGASIDWNTLQKAGAFRPLPLYPFQRKRFWKETKGSLIGRVGDASHPLLGRPVEGPGKEWTVDISEARVPWLSEHVVAGDIVFPGAGYVEIGLALQEALSESGAMMVERLSFVSGLVIDPARTRQLRTVLDPDGRRFTVYSADAMDDEKVWIRHAEGRLCDVAPERPDPLDLGALLQGGSTARSGADIYDQLSALGLEYEGRFRPISELTTFKDNALAELDFAESEHTEYNLHPALLDGCFQSLIAALPVQDARLFVPTSIRQVRVYGAAPERVFCQTRISSITSERLVGDLVLCNRDGEVFAEVRGVACSALARAQHQEKQVEDWLFTIDWQVALAPRTAELPPSNWVICAEPSARTVGLMRKLSQTQGVQAALISPDEVASNEQVKEADIMLYCAPESGDPAGVFASGELLKLVQLCAGDLTSPPKLVVLSAGGAGVTPARPADGGLMGVMRVVSTEYPELKPLVLDLPLDTKPEDWGAVMSEIFADADEAEVLLEQGNRRVPRFRRTTFEKEPDLTFAHQPLGAAPVSLATPSTAGIDGVFWQETTLAPLAPDEVRLEIIAHSINFKDILKILNLLDAAATQNTFYGPALGMEASARVIAVGAGVETLKVGDEIVALTKGGIHSIVTTRIEDLFWMPRVPSLDAATNASLMIVYGTAFETLTRLADVGPGEKVLIHAGAGGVGQAAIKICQMLGAKVYATAGSPEKRQLLRDQGCRGVYDSRSLEFAEAIRQDTDGYGVDVVLNSISGEAATASFELLAPHGRFIEIGKRDFEAGRDMQLAPFNRALTYIAYDMDRRLAERPERHAQMMQDLWHHFENGSLVPDAPQALNADEFPQALRVLSQSKNVGKVVVNFDPQTPVEVRPLAKSSGAAIHPDATYLITGGLTGLGVMSAHALIDLGARHLTLVGRRGAQTPGAGDVIRQLEAKGALVAVLAADMSDPDQVQQLIQHIETDLPPLKGIIHGAGILDDGMISGQTVERLQQVMGPKAAGAWHLHEATAHLPLDHFVIYSSVSAIFGNSGQVAYAAANAMADALISHRRAQGLAGLSINWGAVAEIGMAARDQSVLDYFETMGLAAMAPEKVSEALKRGLASSHHQLIVADLDIDRFVKAASRKAAAPFYDYLREEVGEDGTDFLDSLTGLEPEARDAALVESVRDVVAATVKMSASDIDLATPLANLGIDSLMTVELQMGLSVKFGVEFSTMQLMQSKGVASLAKDLDHLLFESVEIAAE